MSESRMRLFVLKDEYTEDEFKSLIGEMSGDQVVVRISSYGDEWWVAGLSSTVARSVMRALDDRGHDYDYE